MKRIFWIGLAAMTIVALLLPRVADAGQRRLGRMVLHILKTDHGARMSGMGGSFVAIADDIDAIHVNPAGLTHVERMEYTFSYTRWLANSNFFSGAVAYKSGFGILGVSVVSFSPEQMEERTIFQPQGTGRMLDAGNVSIGVAYARKITDRLSFGLVGRWTQDTLDQDRVSAVDISMGTFFYTGFRNLRIAMAFKDLGKDVEVFEEVNYSLPTTFSFAVAMEAFGQKGDPAVLTATAENYFATDFAEPQARIGGELWLQNIVAVRAGYRFKQPAQSYTLGFGLKLQPVEGKEVRADFSYTQFDYFDAPLRFSLSGSF